MIQKDTTIEQLLEWYPPAALFLSKRGIRCIACGEPIWGTIEEAAIEKGFSMPEIDLIVQELNQLYVQKIP
jgi:hypothetical protein